MTPAVGIHQRIVQDHALAIIFGAEEASQSKSDKEHDLLLRTERQGAGSETSALTCGLLALSKRSASKG